MPVVRIVDGEVEDVGQFPRAVVLEQAEPGVDGARDGGGERSGSGDHVEALAAIVLDRRCRRRRTLPHHHLRPRGLFGGGEDPGHVAARPIEVGFDHMEEEGPGHGRVEGVAAAFEHRLRGRGGQPVRRGGHAEVPLEGGARGEGGGWGEWHGSVLWQRCLGQSHAGGLSRFRLYSCFGHSLFIADKLLFHYSFVYKKFLRLLDCAPRCARACRSRARHRRAFPPCEREP